VIGGNGVWQREGVSAGIALLSPRVERFLPPPLAVTLAAQFGVAPVLLPAFGAMPLVAIPANLLALPAAGPLMTWGLAAGLVAVAVAGAPLSSSRDRLASDRLWRADGHTVVVTSGRGPPGRLLSALRARRVRSIDVLAVTSRSASAGASVGAVAARIPTRLVLAPTDRRYGVPATPTVGLRPGVRVRVGPLVVVVARDIKQGRASPSVRVQVASSRATGGHGEERLTHAARARPP